jgi:hypothetical protein
VTNQNVEMPYIDSLLKLLGVGAGVLNTSLPGGIVGAVGAGGNWLADLIKKMTGGGPSENFPVEGPGTGTGGPETSIGDVNRPGGQEEFGPWNTGPAPTYGGDESPDIFSEPIQPDFSTWGPDLNLNQGGGDWWNLPDIGWQI